MVIQAESPPTGHGQAGPEPGSSAGQAAPLDSGGEEEPRPSSLVLSVRRAARKWHLSTSEELGPAERRARARRAVGFTMLSVGLCLFVFLGYLFIFSNLQEARNQRHLLNVFAIPAQAKVPLSGRVPPNGQPAAILQIPALGLKQVVVQGTTSADLLQGPGVMPDTARPGTKGNAVIAGRHATGGAVFADLDKLVKGDVIHLTTGLGKFVYRVRTIGIARAGQVSPASPTHRAQLTLMTAASLTGDSVLYVRSRLVTTPGSAPRPKHPPSPTQLGLSGDPSAWGPTVAWGLVLVLTLAVSFVIYTRARSKVWTIYLLSTPILLAVALEWYHYLYLLLPATI